MYSICTNKSPKIIIKHIKYKLNEEQYFDIEIEMERNAWRVVDMWMWDTPPPEGGVVCNIGQLVRCFKLLWDGSTRGTATAVSWAVSWLDGNNNQYLTTDPPSYIFFFCALKKLTAIIHLFPYDLHIQISTRNP